MPHVTPVQEESGNNVMSFPDFIKTHVNQLNASGVPELYWPTLYGKLSNELFDAGEIFKILCFESEGDNTSHKWKVIATSDVKTTDPVQIYLIDHAWTYRMSDCRGQLEGIPQLRERMATLMEVETEGRDHGEVVEDIMQNMWKFNQTYSIGNYERGSEESMPIWYIMDEFGSRIQHSDDPSCRTAPFFFAPLQISFTLLWPVTDLKENDELTRDYIPSVTDASLRQCRLLPWIPCDMSDMDYKQKEPDLSYFQSFLKMEKHTELQEFKDLPKDRNLKVYMDYPTLPNFLTDPRFELVSSQTDADILFLIQHWKDFEKLENRFINQFPFERLLTVKDLLAVVSRRAGDGTEDQTLLDRTPHWLPITYNLETELQSFVSYFQHRQERGLDNHWICKPWNLGRGLDMHITNNLDYIMRLPETGPKVACKYIEDPVLFFREEIGNVKFDIRYVVMLSSVKPLKLFAYKVFWLRFANRAYSLDHFDEYEKHFTVMNYVEEGKNLKQVHYDDFIPMFEAQYPAFKWSEVEESIFQMTRELFTAATSLPAPQGIGHCPQSRAMYAIDLMLQWRTNKKGDRYMQPIICEVNFSPDCDRACKYHPHFVNDILSTLFLDDIEGRPVQLL